MGLSAVSAKREIHTVSLLHRLIPCVYVSFSKVFVLFLCKCITVFIYILQRYSQPDPANPGTQSHMALYKILNG